MNGEPTRRDWMKVGQKYYENRQPELERAIRSLKWIVLDYDNPPSLPMSQGLGLKHAIAELRLPKVDMIAWNGGYFEFPDGPGFPHAMDSKGYGTILGIQAHCKDCDVRVYLLNHGDGITPLACDVWEKSAEVQAFEKDPVPA